MVLEIDGDTHATDEQRAYDARRDAYMAERGWLVVRVWNADIYRNVDEVLDSVVHQADARISRL
jgi:very-short-patch-repair endonuclease